MKRWQAIRIHTRGPVLDQSALCELRRGGRGLLLVPNFIKHLGVPDGRVGIVEDQDVVGLDVKTANGKIRGAGQHLDWLIGGGLAQNHDLVVGKATEVAALDVGRARRLEQPVVDGLLKNGIAPLLERLGILGTFLGVRIL